MTFEDMLRREVNAGKSLDDIAKLMENALNQVRNETKAKTKKEEALNSMLGIFKRHYEKKILDLNDVGALAVLCVQNEYPNWTIKDCEDFQKNVVENIKALADMQGKNPGEILKSVLGDIVGDVDKALNKSKNEKDKCTCGHGTVPVRQAPKSDFDRIKEFLYDL